jgi:hypothetical protein
MKHICQGTRMSYIRHAIKNSWNERQKVLRTRNAYEIDNSWNTWINGIFIFAMRDVCIDWLERTYCTTL